MKIPLLSLQHEIQDCIRHRYGDGGTAPCQVIFPVAVAGTGRGNYQAAVQEDQEGRGQVRGQGAQEVRGGRARNADSVDTELTGGYMGHGMGTLCSILPHYAVPSNHHCHYVLF